MGTALVSLAAAPAAASAQQLSRAQAVAQAVGANPEVKQSLEQVALLEGRITEARADAFPDVSWSTSVIRSRDPGLLNSPIAVASSIVTAWAATVMSAPRLTCALTISL